MFHDNIMASIPMTHTNRQSNETPAKTSIHPPSTPSHLPLLFLTPHHLTSHNKPISHMSQHPPPLLMMRKPRHISRNNHSMGIQNRMDERKVFLQVW